MKLNHYNLMKYIYSIFLIHFLNSCSYPDVDNVPNFDDIQLSEDEIIDYCSSLNTEKINIDKCINNYKKDNKL